MSASVLSKLPQLQAAIRALAGVGLASIRWPEPQGPATLRIELVPGVDRAEATASILDTLATVAGADLSSLRVELPPPPRGNRSPARPVRVGRPVFERLAVRRSALDATVTVSLSYDGRNLSGEAEGLARGQSIPRTAAAATLAALADVLPRDLRVQVDWLEVHDGGHATRPAVVQVAVALLSPSDEETVIGSALVRDEVREAAVRATLDAVNRRLPHLLRSPRRAVAT